VARAARTGSRVDIALLVISILLSLVALALPARLRDPAAAAVRRSVGAPLAELQRYSEVNRARFVSYEDRMRVRGDTAILAMDVPALTNENRRLRNMLGLGARLEWGFVAAEALPAVPSQMVRDPLVLNLTLTAGSNAGVEPFTPVITPNGLVGMVQSVDPTTSLAITYSHPDFRVSAQTADESAYGIVQPYLGGRERSSLLEMRGVAFRSQLKPGALIVSSGLGATYPEGIPVGTVLREIETPEKWARTYLLVPAAPLADVGPVLLLRKERGVAGVQNVWTSVGAADSAARSVASAGDSMAAQAAQAELAARRAAMDSVRGDSLPVDTTAAAQPATPRPIPPATPPATAPVTPPVTTPVPRPRTDSAARAPVRPPVRTPARTTPDTTRRTTRPDSAAPARPAVPRPTVPRPTTPAVRP
jgi:rod shape-determining protein MreC